MINVIVELSKYVILTLMVVYTFHCFYMVRRQDEDEKNEALRQQLVLIFFMDYRISCNLFKDGQFSGDYLLSGNDGIFCGDPDFIQGVL